MNVLEMIWSKYWSYRLLLKCRRNYVINKDERDRERVLRRGIEIEREWKGDKIYMYYSFSITKLQKPKENFLAFKFDIKVTY